MRALIFAIISAFTACGRLTNYVENVKDKSIDNIPNITANYSYDTTLVNNQNKFLLTTKIISNEKMLLNVSFDSHTTTLDTLYYKALAYIEYIDFDKDGNTDILVDYIGNNSTYFLFLFDQRSNSFKAINNYSSFPDAVQLKANPKFYYSYHRAGCADENWESDLLQIIDFKIIHLGNIDGHGCEMDNLRSINIYKVIDKNKKLIDSLNYSSAIKDSIDKWTFIEKYWNRNYKMFK
jgi:hypothetical protein